MYNILLIALIAVGFWLAVLFLDTIFKSCMLPPYVNLLNEGTLKVKPGYIQLYTTDWNRKLHRWGCWRPKLQTNWFNIGTLCSCLLMPISVIFLLSMTRNILLKQEASSEQIIQPVLPGVNLPISEVAFYLLTLLFCSITHELGHALSSTRQDLKVDGVGIFFLGIFPGAYVNLPTDQVTQLSPWQQLQIFCAGVWHNVALASVAYLLLVINPYVAMPFYQSGNGILCTGVVQGSGVSGPAGLKYGDQVIAVDNCAVKSRVDWFRCIDEAIREPQKGFCIATEFLGRQDANHRPLSEKDCCTNLTSSHLCFRVDQRLSCLPVRKMLQTSPFSCSTSDDCDHCAEPILDNRYRLLQIRRRNRDAVLFVGNPLELKTTVEISSYIHRMSWIPIFVVTTWEKILNYILAFSGALAVLNVVPCWGLDGQWITQALVNLTLHTFLQKRDRQTVACVLTAGGTALLVTNVLFGIYSLFR